MGLVSICAIGAFRACGVLIFLAFLVTPTLIARRLSHSLKAVVLLSCLAAAISSVVGVALSRHILSVYGVACSTSGIIVTLLALGYGVTLLAQELWPCNLSCRKA